MPEIRSMDCRGKRQKQATAQVKTRRMFCFNELPRPVSNILGSPASPHGDLSSVKRFGVLDALALTAVSCRFMAGEFQGDRGTASEPQLGPQQTGGNVGRHAGALSGRTGCAPHLDATASCTSAHHKHSPVWNSILTSQWLDGRLLFPSVMNPGSGSES